MSDEKMNRQRDVVWCPPNTWANVPLQVLMDIRDELKVLNNIMRCSNVAKGFSALAKIARRDEKMFKRRVDHAVAKRVKRAKS